MKCPECGAEKNELSLKGHLVLSHHYSVSEAVQRAAEMK